MERLRKSDVEQLVNRVNRVLASHKSRYVIKLGHRYDYYAIDKCNVTDSGESTLFTGTLRECMYYVKGMSSLLDIFGL